MKAVIQRVTKASVSVDNIIVSKIGQGLMILLGVVNNDTMSDVDWMVRKCAQMRIFDDDAGIMNRSVVDVNGEILVVSQFTLAANIQRGNRPSYINAAGHDLAIPLYEAFCQKLSQAIGKQVAKGIFGADMKVELINDGPVTIIADTADHN